MSNTKDNFTNQADKYAKYRPVYPQALYDFLLSLVDSREAAWDCGTGNGQVAVVLSVFFDRVFATDINQKQIEKAAQRPNIIYRIESAESNTFADNSFGLITVAQAIHWFNFDNFYKEVNRTARNNAIFAVIGYGLVRVDEPVNTILDKFYYNTVGPFWDKERKYLDENYATIPFPFDEIESPSLINIFDWTIDEFVGYLETWSAVQHYIKANQSDPVILVRKELEAIWPLGTTKNIQFPILLRVARIKKVLT